MREKVLPTADLTSKNKWHRSCSVFKKQKICNTKFTQLSANLFPFVQHFTIHVGLSSPKFQHCSKSLSFVLREDFVSKLTQTDPSSYNSLCIWFDLSRYLMFELWQLPAALHWKHDPFFEFKNILINLINKFPTFMWLSTNHYCTWWIWCSFD